MLMNALQHGFGPMLEFGFLTQLIMSVNRLKLKKIIVSCS